MADALPESIVEPHHAMVRSTDGGKSWYFHRYLYFPMVVAGDAHVIAQLRNGLILEIPNNVHAMGQDEFYAPLWKSSDEGRTFHGPYDAPLMLPKGCVETVPAAGRTLADIRFYRSIVELANGELLASMYGVFRGERKYRCFLVRSRDEGKTWLFVSTIAYDPEVGSEGFCEPAMVLLPNNELLCVMRTGSGEALYACRSRDSGETWTNPFAIGVRGVDPDLLVLSNGVVACSYGRLKPRREIEPSSALDPRIAASLGDAIIFSVDSGETWTHPTTIYEGASTGYTGIEEPRPNELLYAFDTLGYGWHRYNSIRVVSLKVTNAQCG